MPDGEDRADASLRAAQEALLDTVGAYLFTKDVACRYTYANPATCRLFGRSLADIVGHDDSEFFDLERADALREHDRLVLKEGRTIEQEEVSVLADTGERRVYWAIKAPVHDDAGRIIGLVGISTDITDRKALEAELARRNRLLTTVLGSMDAHVYMKDRDGRMLYVNQHVADALDLPVEDVIGRLDRDLWPVESLAEVRRRDRRQFETGLTERREETFVDAHGRPRHFWSVTVPLTDHEPEVLIGLATDVTELHRLREALERQATTDELTGIANRRHLFAEGEREVSRSLRHRLPFTVLMVDIDHFKAVNDTHGHQAGDVVLLSVAQVLAQGLRGADVIGRIGGEEFAILLPDTDIDGAHELAERLRAEVAETVIPLASGTDVRVTVSIGASSLREGESAVDAVLARADEALYRAKRDGRNRVRTST
jgi:diguanylate cyclase (GGDEF)-like protein/PAS domain S-box-containing protein